MKTILITWIRRIFGSLLFIGYIPLAPGTLGSAAATALLWYSNIRYPSFFAPTAALGFWIVCVVLTGVSIVLANDARAVFGKNYTGPFIFDEVAGQAITFLFVPLAPRTLILGFVLFRFFDIVKPYPVHMLEDVEDGTGITMDDVAAGVYANISLQAILITYHAIRNWLA